MKKQLASQALPHLTFAAKTSPKDPVIQYHLGMAYAGIGDSVNARRVLKQALAINQGFPGADVAQKTLETLK